MPIASTRLFVCLGAFLLALLPRPARAHGDFHSVIIDINQQIEASPKNPELYIRRGELYRTHQDWDSAYADFDRAATLDPKSPFIDFVRGRLFLEANWLFSAQRVLDRFLTHQTNHIEGFITRARVLTKLTQHVAAASDFTRAIALSPEPSPDLFIERAQTLTAAGEGHFDEALQGLDEGVKRLGQLVTLQLYAIDMETKQQRFDGALARLDKVAAQFPRKETWLARRGEILQQAGRPAEARDAFKAALAAIAQLPATRRNVPAMVELEKRLQDQLKASGAGGDTGNKKPRTP